MTIRRSIQGAFFVGLASLTACGQDVTASPVAPAPPPVAPVEVTPGDDQREVADPEAEELGRLRERVAELERELAACRTPTPPSGTETAPIPQGVDVPAVEPTPTATHTNAPDAGARRRTRERGVLGTLLGTDGQRRREPETIELPNPARILLGE